MDGKYDIAIIGGGVAGLTAARLLSMAGFMVTLFEKKSYPFHRVCGEYISNESVPMLDYIGMDLKKMSPPAISEFELTLPGGSSIKTPLPLGGIGLSRFRLDYDLAQLGFQSGVDFWENTTVKSVKYQDDCHVIETSQGTFEAKVCIGSFGKRSGIDKQLGRSFQKGNPDPEEHFIAVKYHVEADLPKDRIELHVFDKGYCGISAIEENRYCLCYLTTAANLQKYGTIGEMEDRSLSVNPALKGYLKNVKSLYDGPQVISQISFKPKSQIEDHILMTGDSAGLISPLCGNGISMAMHSSAILAPIVADFLDNKITRAEMENRFEMLWKKNFRKRMATGRWLQKLFFKPRLLNKLLPVLAGNRFTRERLISMTHGKPFYLNPDFQERLVSHFAGTG